MKEFTLEQKMQVCGYCRKYVENKPIMFFAGDYCKSVGALIADIKSCPAWVDFWKDETPQEKEPLREKEKSVKCENCGKIITDKVITICSLEKMEELKLCVNCFLGLTAEKVGKEIEVIKNGGD